MENARDFKEIEDYAAACIRHKVRQLITRLGFEASEREDMEQDIAADLYYRLQDYEADRASIKTFIVRVVENKARTMIQARNKRAADLGGPLLSLDEPFTDEDGCTCELSDEIDSEDCMLRAGLITCQTFEQCDMRVDIERIVSKLPESLQEICLYLQQTPSITEISEATGRSRQQVYSAIRKLHRIFDWAGFADYL